MEQLFIDFEKFINYEWVGIEDEMLVHALRDEEMELSDVPTLIMGIGGTGVAAAKVVKKKVEQHYHPSVAKRIEYLFIDTDGSSVADVKGADKLVIQSADTAILLREYKKQAERGINSEQGEANPTLPCEITEWLDSELSPFRVMNGAAGIRQAGRLILFLNINRVYHMLQKKMRKVSVGYDLQKTRVKVHLFTGIGGGTGSGIFADISYLIRNINATCEIQGFVFMPDVSCMKAGLHDVHRRNIKRNGFAALCEIEQLMTLEQYGERFEQKYPGKVPDVSSSFPVFDFCVMIGSMQNGRETLVSEDEVFERVAEYLLLELNKNKPGAFGFESYKSNLANKDDGSKCHYYTKYISIGADARYLAIDYYYSLWLNDVFQQICIGLSEQKNATDLINEIIENRKIHWVKHEKDAPRFYYKKNKRFNKIVECIKTEMSKSVMPNSLNSKLYLLGSHSKNMESKIQNIEWRIEASNKGFPLKRINTAWKKLVFPHCYSEAFYSEKGYIKRLKEITSKSDGFLNLMRAITDKSRKYAEPYPAFESERAKFEMIQRNDDYKSSILEGATVIVDDFLKNTEIWLGQKGFASATCLSDYVARLVKGSFENSGCATIYKLLENTSEKGKTSIKDVFKTDVLDKLKVTPLWPIKEGYIAETLPQYTDKKVLAHPDDVNIKKFAEEWCEAASDPIALLPNQLHTRVSMGVYACGYYLRSYYGLDDFKLEYDNATQRAGLHLYAGKRVNWNRPFLLYDWSDSQNHSEKTRVKELKKIFDDAISKGVICYDIATKRYLCKMSGGECSIGNIKEEDETKARNLAFEFFIRMPKLQEKIRQEVSKSEKS